VVTPGLQLSLQQFAARDYRSVVAAVARITGDHATAADSVQDAVLGILESPPAQPIKNLAAWITVVATNRSRDRQRRTLAEARALGRLGIRHDVLDVVVPFDGSLRAAIAALPQRQREICVLHYVLDESIDAIAAHLRVSSGAVKTHLFRARRTLAARMRDEAAAAA
jgi:RNA polymerase sigma-70 factor, ECF subfamily